MPAARRRDPWAPPGDDPQRALVQAYTRLIRVRARPDGSKIAVIASLGTCDIRLVEILPPDQPPENARLRVELYDRLRAQPLDSVACRDLHEAEAATDGFLASARRRRSNEGSSNDAHSGPQLVSADASAIQDRPHAVGARPVVTLQPVSVLTGSVDGDGFLALAGGRLVAVLVRLSAELHGAELGGNWFLEAGFGRCEPSGRRVFENPSDAEEWLVGRLVGGC